MPAGEFRAELHDQLLELRQHHAGGLALTHQRLHDLPGAALAAVPALGFREVHVRIGLWRQLYLLISYQENNSKRKIALFFETGRQTSAFWPI